MKLQTTLAILRAATPCAEGWAKLLRHIGTDYPACKPIDFATILESNGIDDALWGLRAVLPEQEPARDRAARLFACDCAEAVLPIFERQVPTDARLREAIRIARAFAHGAATTDDIAAAWVAARAAAGAAAADAAGDAAWAAAGAAAWAAAGAAAGAAQRELFIRHFCTD